MGKGKELKHYVLGLERRPSGAFEYSWKVAQNLRTRGFDIDYLAHWWDSPVKRVDLDTGKESFFDFESASENAGVYHLHTHTWEHDGLLSKISKNPDSKILYTMHAILPYKYFDDKDGFLEGRVSFREMMDSVVPFMSDKNMFQLSAIKKADCLFAISKSHKRVLEKMEVKKDIYVFENIPDINFFDENILEMARFSGNNFRKKLGVENLILYCGGIYGEKGTGRLLGAFQKIRDIYPSSKLILLGSGNKEREKIFFKEISEEYLRGVDLVPWIDKNNLEQRVDFLKYYYAADVLIHPMITDNLFSRTVIDAMSLELPTITCRSPYSIGSSRTKEDIFDSFVYMKNNSSEVERIVKSAKEKVDRENTWDSYASRIDEIVSDNL